MSSMEKNFKEKVDLHTCICEEIETKTEYGQSLDTLGASWTDLRLVYREGFGGWSIWAYGDDEAMTSINYCPFCGRRLYNGVN